MGAIDEAELRQLGHDKEFSRLAVSESANSFVRELNGGLGEEMLNELNRKPVEKSRIRKFFEKIFRTI